MTFVSQLFVYFLSYNEHYFQPGDLFRTRILYPFHFFRELPQLSEDESCMSAIAQGKESGGSDIDFQTTSHSERFDQN